MTTMTFPFEITPAGKVASSSGIDAMLQQVKLVVSTTLGSRAMRPDFGSGVGNLVFDTLAVTDDVRDTIIQAVASTVEGAKVADVEVTADENTGVFDVVVYVQPTNEVTPRTFSVSLSFGRVVEETVQ